LHPKGLSQIRQNKGVTVGPLEGLTRNLLFVFEYVNSLSQLRG